MPLRRFGFTATEVRAYEALVKVGPATGYGVAAASGLARANAYEALEGLVRRGAARRTTTKPPRFIAVPSSALLAELERSFRRNLTAVEEQLKQLARADPIEATSDTESLSDATSLLRSAARCFSSAEKELYVVLGPWCSALYPALDRVTSGHVSVRTLCLGEPAPRGATLRAVSEPDLEAYWGGRPLLVVVDRAASVCGVFAADGSATGMTTRAPGIVPFFRHLLRRELASLSSTA